MKKAKCVKDILDRGKHIALITSLDDKKYQSCYIYSNLIECLHYIGGAQDMLNVSNMLNMYKVWLLTDVIIKTYKNNFDKWKVDSIGEQEILKEYHKIK